MYAFLYFEGVPQSWELSGFEKTFSYYNRMYFYNKIEKIN